MSSYILQETGDRLLQESGDGILRDIRIVVFVPAPPTLADVLRGSHRPISKVEFLGADLQSILATVRDKGTGGSVTSDRTSDTFISATVELVNADGTLTPGAPDALLANERNVRVWRGALVGGTEIFEPLITGIVADPQTGLDTGKVTFTVSSRLAIAKRNFSGPTTIAAGTDGKDAIRQLLELGGLGTTDQLYDLDDGGFVVATARTFSTGDEILGSASGWAADMGCDLWIDGNGVVKMAPVVDPTTVSPVWDFAGGSSKILTEFDAKLPSQVRFNRQDVFGIGPDGYTISATAVITNPADPLMWTPALDLPADPYTSPDINDPVTALAVARQLLAEHSGYVEQIQFHSVPVPLVRGRDVVSFSGAGYGNSLLDTVTMSIYHGDMSGTARLVRSIAL
jgi:hypothetical protein